MKNLLTIATISLMMLSGCSTCERETNICDYKPRELVTMEVVEIKALEDDQVEIVVEFNKSIFASEKRNLGELRNQQTDSAYVERNKIQVGNKYQCEVTEPVDLNCAEPMISFNNEFK